MNHTLMDKRGDKETMIINVNTDSVHIQRCYERGLGVEWLQKNETHESNGA